jgi:hypothetical protein
MALLAPDCIGCGPDNRSSNFLNTFQGNISKIREAGYAANQVDYVCHSMGGCILRTATTVYKDLFYGTGFYGISGTIPNDYRTYEKGFVHKAITINTPHNGSPVADAVTEFIPQASKKINTILTATYATCPNNLPFSSFNLWNYIQPIDPNSNVFAFEATGAVKNLQVVGDGRFKLAATNVKHHLIAGDIDLYTSETASFLASMDSYVELLDNVLTIVRDVLPKSPDKTYLTAVSTLAKGARAFTFVEWYSEQQQFPNYWGDGDMIVPLASQLALRNVPANFSTHSKIFKNTSFLNANHLDIVNRLDVGNHVLDLLNKSIHDNAFGDIIDANPIQSAPVLRSKSIVSEALPIETYFNKTHIEIITPDEGEVIKANDPVELIFQVKDTVDLAYIDYLFQNNHDIMTGKSELQSVTFNVSPDFLGRQTIYVSATYDREDKTVSYIDSITVNVVTEENLVDFRIDPLVAHIYKDERYYPPMTAIYETFLSNVVGNSDKLSIHIDDPSVIAYDEMLHCFTGLQEGTTFAAINYENRADTLYFNVMEVPDMEVTGIIEISSGKSTVSTLSIYPNPVVNIFSLYMDTPDNEKYQVSIYNLKGQMIERREVSGHSETFDIAHYPQGIYIVRVVTQSGEALSGKLIKQDR